MVTKRFYEIFGLSSKDDVISSLLTALPIMLIGLFLCYIAFWSKGARNTKRADGKPMPVRHYFGCLGMVVIAVGCFFVLPLWGWIEATFVGIMTVIITGYIGVMALVFLYSCIFKK